MSAAAPSNVVEVSNLPAAVMDSEEKMVCLGVEWW